MVSAVIPVESEATARVVNPRWRRVWYHPRCPARVVNPRLKLEGSYCSKTPPDDGTADWTLAVLVRGRFQKV